MTQYEKAVALWPQKNITNDAELAEALHSYSIAFAYHSGKIENEKITYHDTREIFEHDGAPIRVISALFLRSATQRRQTSCFWRRSAKNVRWMQS